ncbi:MAG: hypothetical protein PWQ97_1589 [Tepidanaerobacteraceae bacterium]|nr:hypothetical protein [Tepidanaerobacteraceae bacterium]
MRSIESRILIPFLILIIASLSIVGITSYYGSYKIIQDMADRLPQNVGQMDAVYSGQLLELQKYTILVAIIAIIIAAQLTIFFSYNLTKPIKKFSLACEEIARGNFDIKIEYNRNDEIAVLKDAFNTMSVKLSEYIKKMEHVNRLTFLGEMSAVLAHEIRNPLQGIQVCFQAMESKLPADDGKLESIFSSIYREIERINNIISNLLNFARPGEPQPEKVLIQKLMQEVMPFIEPVLKNKNLTLYCNFSNAKEHLFADRGHLKQILINLITNAARASNQGDTIEVSSFFTDEEIIISIKDSGVGIPETNLDKIFNPFFTTFENGTGVGLSVVHSLTLKNHGRIWVESSENMGTTVYVAFPRSFPH